jgi:hypothetical protein
MQHHAATDFWNEYLALPRAKYATAPTNVFHC